MATLWRYRRNGEEFGPVTSDDLKLLAESQRLLPTDLVRKDGSPRWIQARSVRGLFAGEPAGLLGRAVAVWGRAGLIASGVAVVVVLAGAAALVIALHNSSAAGTGQPEPSAAPAASTNQATTDADKKPPRHLLAALHELRESRDELRGDERDGGEPIREASRAVDRAVEQIEKALRAGGYEVDAPRPDPESYRKYSDHPHLRRARDEIVEARVELRDAKASLGDERERTLHELEFAAEKLEAALEHPR